MPTVLITEPIAEISKCSLLLCVWSVFRKICKETGLLRYKSRKSIVQIKGVNK